MTAQTIGVFPPGALEERRRLFSALASVFGLEFAPREFGEWRGLAGVVAFTDSPGMTAELMTAGVASLVAPRDNPDREPTATPFSITFGRNEAVDERLRGRSLEEFRCRFPPLHIMGGEVVLAHMSDGPVWTVVEVASGRALHRVSVAPEELGPGERLKEHLAFRRFCALLPLVHFLRGLTGFSAWNRPALRASFILDDPNLHWPSYGYIRYRDLAEHAAEHFYHVGIAMLPLDAAITHPGTVRVFRDCPELSLLVHGNDHVKRELDRPVTVADPLAVAAQALRRVAAFESRTGASVCRIMVPPHDDYLKGKASVESWCPPPGACSEEMMVALGRVGFEGICYWGPSRTGMFHEMVGWSPADMHFGEGFPGLHRMTFDAPMDELVLRGFLDQPLILFGHNEDLAGSLDAIANAAARVNSAGEIAWGSSTDALRSNYFSRQDGDVLRIRPFANRIGIRVDPGTTHAVVERTGETHRDEVTITAMGPDGRARRAGGGLGVSVALPGVGDLDMQIFGADQVDPDTVQPPPWRPWPLVRRCLTESRDRMQPIAGRVREALNR